MVTILDDPEPELPCLADSFEESMVHDDGTRGPPIPKVMAQFPHPAESCQDEPAGEVVVDYF